MASRKQIAAARRNIKKAQRAAARKRRGRGRRAASANPRKRKKTRAAAAAANPRRKRRRAAAAANPRRKRRRAAAAANPKRKRRRAAAAANPKRKRRRSQANDNSWKGQPIRHKKAAKKGWRRKKAKSAARRRRSHRANPSLPATNINVSATAPNPWAGQPRRHAKAAKLGWRRRKAGKGRSKARGKKRCPPCRPRRTSGGQFAGGFTRRDLAANPQSIVPSSNPYMPALYENPFDTKSVVSYGAAAVTTAVGLIVADLVDRVVATRKPAKGPTGAEAKRPWYGRDAAAAQRMRPDAWRLGAQAAGAVISLVLAYFARNIKVVPWLLGGFGLGFGVNLLKKLSDWWLMPALLKVKEGEEGAESLGNRLFPMEQDSIQKQIATMFANWDTVDSLKNQQQEVAQIQSPLGNTATGPAYQLGNPSGKAQGNGDSANTVGAPQRKFVNTGRLGNCLECGGHNGCYSDCGTLCPNCPSYQPRSSCKYTVKAGDDLARLCAAGGVSVTDVDAMNGGTPDTYWQEGNTVNLPYGICMVLEREPPSNGSQPTGPFMAPMPEMMVPVAGAPDPQPVVAKPATTNLFNLGAEDSSDEE